MRRDTTVEFNGSQIANKLKNELQAISNEALAQNLPEEKFRDYFLSCVGACMHPQRYKKSDVNLLLKVKINFDAKKPENKYVVEAMYRLEELHEQIELCNIFKPENSKTEMGCD